MKYGLAVVILLSGCAYQFDPFKGQTDAQKQEIQQVIQAINALNDFSVKLDTRVGKLEHKK